MKIRSTHDVVRPMRHRLFALVALVSSASTACGNADPITCGATTCGGGQVCITRYGGADTGVAQTPSTSCADVPIGCVLTDQNCNSGGCGCADQICGPAGASSVSGNGRRITCRGQ